MLSVFCGDIDFSWDALGATAQWVGKQETKSNFVGFRSFEIAYTVRAATFYRADSIEIWDWVYILEGHRDLDATDPRDKVFTLLGLPSFARLSAESTTVTPNYHKSILKVYTTVVETAIRVKGNLFMLSYLSQSVRACGKPTFMGSSLGRRCSNFDSGLSERSLYLLGQWKCQARSVRRRLENRRPYSDRERHLSCHYKGYRRSYGFRSFSTCQRKL